MTLTAIDLFCGAGGFSKGFENAGIKVVYGVDINPAFEKTFTENHLSTRFLCYDISREVPKEIKECELDIVFGSPPCQGFSDARGNREPQNKIQIMRNSLPIHFARWVKELRPKIVMMENVSGMATYRVGGKLFIDILKRIFNKIGYDFTWKILNSADFGVPQERRRVFCLGIRKDLKLKAVLRIDPLRHRFGEKVVTVNDAISDLPEVANTPDEVVEHIPRGHLHPYQKLMRKNSERVFNHCTITKFDKNVLRILKRIPEGKIYRSSRFGERYVGVWEIFGDELKDDEKELLHFLCKKRTNNKYKQLKGRYKEGYLFLSAFPTDKDGKFLWSDEYPKYGRNDNRTPEQIINSLLRNKWIRVKTFNGVPAYDINTKSGIRPLYMRLSRDKPSRTIMTTSFSPRELVHPTEHRPITLREGARLQSFPDNFIFFGRPKEIAIQIGNAVPPLMAQELGMFLTELSQHFI